MSGKQYFWASLVCVLCLALALPVLSAQAAEKVVEQTIATVVSVTPGAWVERLGSKMPVTQGMNLQRVDTLSTDAQGAVELRFTEGTTASLGAGTRMALESFDLRPETADLHMRVAAGSARVVSGGITKMRPDALRVFTPMATIGIRGTDCALLASPTKTTLVVNSIGEKDILIVNMLTLEESTLNKAGQAIEVMPEGNVLREATVQEQKYGVPVMR